MQKPHFTQEQLVQVARLSDEDFEYLTAYRGAQNKIGAAYQICYVKLFNRFPIQVPFEILQELATFVAIQMDIPREELNVYALRQPTISEHQEQIRLYLNLARFDKHAERALMEHLFNQSLQIQPTDSLLLKATEFLRERQVLNPADDTITRLIQTQREKARLYMYKRVAAETNASTREKLDDLLVVGAETYSKLYQIKEVPKKPSAKAMKSLAEKLATIELTGALAVNLNWLNNNYKRYLCRYVTRSDANKLRALSPNHRYAALISYLQEAYQDTKDHIFDMYHKAVNTVREQAERAVNDYNRTKRGVTRSCLTNHRKLCHELLAVSEGAAAVEVLLLRYPRANLQSQIEAIDTLLGSKYSNDLTVIADRFSYLRQMARPLLERLTLELSPTANASLSPALQILREILADTRRSVPGNINLDFLSKIIRQAVRDGGGVNRKLFEAAVFTALPEIVKRGDIAIAGSKRYVMLENFFMDPAQWEARREAFFRKNKLPQNPKDVPAYLEARLEDAFTYFLKQEKSNSFARVGKDGWELSKDPAEELGVGRKLELEKLKGWLSDNMRTIKLPDLLIEVDNDLRFTDPFLPASRRQMTDDAHRLALAQIVNGIGGIEVTKAWGEGKTAAGDGQRFGYHRKRLHRTFSHKFNDFAIELYIFVADNYALFYNLAKEATDRDNSKVLDAYLYNVSDLDPEEWYFDTGAYTEINFTAFSMLGKTFCPRIRNIKDQWIYKISVARDYGNLNTLLKGARHTISMEAIVDQWDRMGHFYASLEAGYATASTALRRLTGHTEKNAFYKGNQQLGRVLKTEHILRWMSDPLKRRQARRGLLKNEQVHQLARDITYGSRGRFKGKSLEEINSSGNCTALIIAAITYWQAKEISRVITDNDPEGAGIDISLLTSVSPIEWTNVILYGEYKLNRNLVK